MEEKDALEKTRKWIAERPHPPRYNYKHMTGPKAEYTDIKARIECAGAFIKESPETNEETIIILGRILNHNIPNDIYERVLEGIEEHTRADLKANIPKLEETGFTLYLFDTTDAGDIVP